jgi:hypothetical protein
MAKLKPRADLTFKLLFPDQNEFRWYWCSFLLRVFSNRNTEADTVIILFTCLCWNDDMDKRKTLSLIEKIRKKALICDCKFEERKDDNFRNDIFETTGNFCNCMKNEAEDKWLTIKSQFYFNYSFVSPHLNKL